MDTMEGFDAAMAADISAGNIQIQPGTPAPAPAPVQQPAATPPADTSPKPEPSGSALDGLPDMSALDVAAEEANPSTGEEIQPTEQTPVSPQKAKWEELRTKAKELDQIRPQLESLRKELEEVKQKPSIPEDVQKEIEELRQIRFAVELEKTPEWQQAVDAPSAEVLGQFQQIADFYNVDYNELVAAADDTNPLRRGKSIREFLSRNEVEEVTPEVLSLATSAAEKLHGIYAKMAELKGKSSEVYRSLEAKRSMESEQEKNAREQKYQASHKEVFGLLQQRLPDFFKNTDLAEAVKQARPADEPQMQAYQAAAAVLLPETLKELKAAKQEIAKLSKAVAARAAATPGIGAASAPVEKQSNNDPDGLLSLEAAMRADGFGR